jgi:general L-amino acid transport system substrate-binding protein
MGVNSGWGVKSGWRAAGMTLAAVAAVAVMLSACGGPAEAPADEADAGRGAPAAAAAAESPTLKAVRQRGHLRCGVHQGLVGFAVQDNRGQWRGFDVDFCRAMAAAIFGDGDRVRFTPLTAETRFDALAADRVDVLWRNSSWTMSRDTDGRFAFAGVNYYDGQGFLVRRALDLHNIAELNGARVCVAAGSTSAMNLADEFRSRGVAYTPVIMPTEEAARAAYAREACDAFSGDISALAAARTTLPDPQQHAILADVLSKEPLGPVTRRGDEPWTALVRWTLNAVVLAEELGVTQANARQLARESRDPRIRRLLGAEGDFGAPLGLSGTWALDAVGDVGNYGEIFARNLGPQSPLDLTRGMNAQWNAQTGGLIYGLPIR